MSSGRQRVRAKQAAYLTLVVVLVACGPETGDPECDFVDIESAAFVRDRGGNQCDPCNVSGDELSLAFEWSTTCGAGVEWRANNGCYYNTVRWQNETTGEGGEDEWDVCPLNSPEYEVLPDEPEELDGPQLLFLIADPVPPGDYVFDVDFTFDIEPATVEAELR